MNRDEIDKIFEYVKERFGATQGQTTNKNLVELLKDMQKSFDGPSLGKKSPLTEDQKKLLTNASTQLLVYGAMIAASYFAEKLYKYSTDTLTDEVIKLQKESLELHSKK